VGSGEKGPSEIVSEIKFVATEMGDCRTPNGFFEYDNRIPPLVELAR
jgi:hypothetical protein